MDKPAADDDHAGHDHGKKTESTPAIKEALA